MQEEIGKKAGSLRIDRAYEEVRRLENVCSVFSFISNLGDIFAAECSKNASSEYK